jgi:hypothetical protein
MIIRMRLSPQLAADLLDGQVTAPYPVPPSTAVLQSFWRPNFAENLQSAEISGSL